MAVGSFAAASSCTGCVKMKAEEDEIVSEVKTVAQYLGKLTISTLFIRVAPSLETLVPEA